MASTSTGDLKLCIHCDNDQYEYFSRSELDDGGLLVVCLYCKEIANADLWHELLAAKGDNITYSLDKMSAVSSSSTSNGISEQLMASAKEFVNDVKPDEILPICFEIPCSCGSSDFRNVKDEEGMSTLAHVKVCNRCHDVMGVDESVLLEEIKDFLRKASFKTTECHGCGNTDPDQYIFERDVDSAMVIRCMICSRVVNGSSGQQEDHELISSVAIPSGPKPGVNDKSMDDSSVVTKLTTGARLFNAFAKTGSSRQALNITGLIWVDLGSLASQIAQLKQAKDAGQIPHCTYVDGVVEEVGKSATRLLVAGAACFLPVPVHVGFKIGYCLGAIVAPAGGRALVWAKDQTHHMLKNMEL